MGSASAESGKRRAWEEPPLFAPTSALLASGDADSGAGYIFKLHVSFCLSRSFGLLSFVISSLRISSLWGCLVG